MDSNMEIHIGKEEIMRSSSSLEDEVVTKDLEPYEEELLLMKILMEMASGDNDKSDPRYYEYYKKYMQQIEAYEGFHVDPLNVRVQKFVGCIRPVRLTSINSNKAARFAVEEYNKTQLVDVKLKKLVKVNLYNQYGWARYLTLEDMDGCYYEAKVSQDVGDGHFVLDFFRVAKHYPMKE